MLAPQVKPLGVDLSDAASELLPRQQFLWGPVTKRTLPSAFATRPRFSLRQWA
jgi:hypothetical protein